MTSFRIYNSNPKSIVSTENTVDFNYGLIPQQKSITVNKKLL